MKVAGFLVGAGAAAVAVWGFNTWRYVSDEDLLMAALSDHCIPYVLTGEAPFEDLGRPVGVYDNVHLNISLSNGGHSIIYDNRYVANWGELEGISGGMKFRVCSVDGRLMGGIRQTFSVVPEGFVDRVTVVIRPLGNLVATPDAETVMLLGDEDEMFREITWVEMEMPQYEGNLVRMPIVQSRVAGIAVGSALAEQP